MKYLLHLGLILVSQLSFSQSWSNSKVLDIEVNDNYAGYRHIWSDSVLSNYRLFVMGENHQFKQSNAKFELKTFKYLHQNAGVNTLLLEFGFSRAWFLEHYLHTGDSLALKLLEAHSYKSYKAFYDELKKYQDSIGVDHPIHIKGVDVERFHGLSVCMLDYLLTDLIEEPSDSISLSIESIRALSIYLTTFRSKYQDKESNVFLSNRFSAFNSVTPILSNFSTFKADYRKIMSVENFKLFETVIDQLSVNHKWNNFQSSTMIQGPIYRERYIYSQIKKLCDSLPDDKFYMQFGRMHTPKELEASNAYDTQFKNVVYRLNHQDNSPLKNQILSCGIYYPKYEGFNSEKDQLLTELEKVAVKDSLTLFLLQKDTLESEVFKLFDYVIFNQNELENEGDKLWSDTNLINEKEDDLVTTTAFYFSSKRIVIPSLSNLPLIGKELGNLYSYLGGFNVYDDYGFLWDFEFEGAKFYDAQPSNELDSYKLRFSQFMTYFGRDLSKNKKVLIAPSVGFGIANLTLERQSSTPISVNGVFDDLIVEKTIRYSNPAFVAGVKLDVRFDVKPFCIGASIGGGLDFSDKKWLDKNGDKVATSSNTTLRNRYYGLILGFAF